MIKKYNEFIKENKLNIKFGIKDLLSVLEGNIVDFYKIFNISKDIFKINDNLSDLYNNSDFTKNVEELNLRKDTIQNTDDNETLLLNKYTLKFFFLLDKDAIQIEEPKYIFLQYYKDNIFSDVICYEHKGNINDFYEKLTNASIEIKKGNKTLVYNSSNAGNNWVLNSKNKSKFKEQMDKDEIKKMI